MIVCEALGLVMLRLGLGQIDLSFHFWLLARGV
jgi:hypothetical protein